MDIEEPSFNIIAGRSIAAVRPIFSHDTTHLLVPSGKTVRSYSTRNGRLHSVLGDDFQVDDIIAIQHNPKNNDQILVFTSSGILEVWDLKSKQCLSSISFYNQGKGAEKVVSAAVFDFQQDKTKERKTYVFFTLVKNINLHYKLIDLTSQPEDHAKKKLKSQDSESHILKIFTRPLPGTVHASFSLTGNFVSFCLDKQMCGCQLPPTKIGPNHLSEVSFTCITSHPTDQIAATGNNLGQITIWTNFLRSHPLKTQLHWHPNPLNDLWFSPSGTKLYSGGKEAVIVAWEIDSVQKELIPRVGAPIKFLTSDRENKFLVVAKKDNSVDIIRTDLDKFNNEIVSIIETVKLPNPKLQFAYHVHRDSLVTLGRPGHLQFFPLSGKEPVMHLDVVGRNLFPEDENIMSNPEIWHFSVSPDGEWLVTEDGRDDKINLMEERLKFWHFDKSKNTFEVNSIIHHPHNKRISGIRFSPDSTTVVTTSDDGTFKLWNFDGDSKSWISNRGSSMNNQRVPTRTCFSSDSSLIAVLFNNLITFYGISKNSLEVRDINVYDNTDSDGQVTGMGFGSGNNSHLFVEVRNKLIRIWDLFDQKVMWSYKNNKPMINLSIDPCSDRIVCFSKDDNLLLFSFDRNDPEKISTKKLGSGNGWSITPFFLPKSYQRSESGMFVLTSNQEFISIVDPKHISSSNQSTHMEEAKTMMFGEVFDRESRVVPLIHPKKAAPQFNVDRLVDQLFLKSPSHILPPVEQLCSTFLSCLIMGTNIKAEIETDNE